VILNGFIYQPPREILHLIGAIVECGGHEHLLRFTVPRCVSWLGSSLTLRHSDNLNCQMSLDILTRLCRYAPCLEAIKKYKILLTASKVNLLILCDSFIYSFLFYIADSKGES
jgi:hypothetical protein